MKKTIPIRYIAIVALLLLSLGTVFTYTNYEKFKEFTRHEIEQQFNDKEKTVQERLDSRRFALELLSFNPYIVDSLSEENSPKVKEKIRKYLSMINKRIGFLSIFLMDDEGNCILSTDKRFEGKNYGFRPYFKQALRNGSGAYVALGVTSKRLGLYLSRRVTSYFGRFGVLVAKLDPSTLLNSLTPLNSSGLSVWGATANGILFSPERNGFFSFEQENPVQIKRIMEDRQFEGVKIKSLGFPKGSWVDLTKKGKISAKKGNEEFEIEFMCIMPGVFSVVTVISRDFLPVSLQMLRRAFLLTNGAFILALIPLVVGLFFFRRQYESLISERQEKSRSQYRYRAVLQGNKDGFLVMSPVSFVIEDINNRLYEILEINSKERDLRGSTLLELLEDRDRSRFREMITGDAFQNFELNVHMLNVSGEPVPVIIDFTRHESDDPATSFCYAFVQDMRKGLRDAQKIRLLETAVEQSGSSIIITDREGIIQYVNPAFTRVTGYSTQEVLGQDSRMLKSGQQDEALYREIGETIGSGRLWHGRLCSTDKDGNVFWEDATIAPVQDEEGHITHFIAIKNDITKIVELEEKLSQKVKELEGIMEYAGVGIALIRSRTFLTVNETLAKILNMPKEDIEGASTRILFSSEEEYESFGMIFYPALMRGESVSYEMERLMPNGEKRWFQITATAINPGPIEAMKTVWIGNDITELKHLQIELQEQKLRAEEANRAKSAFLANMSHEIRTPLNGVIGMLSLLGSSSLDEEQKEYVQIAHSSAEALLFLINDILDISKIEAGRMEFDMVDFSLSDILEDFSRSFAIAAEKKGIKFTLDLSEDLPLCLKGDPGRLRQVLINLTGNALKFTEKGSIELSVELVEEEKDEAVIKFLVKDTGIGIPRDKLDLLFKKFSQVDASISRKFGGTGLGLAISKRLVELMGGRIGVESQAGKGSTFWFTVRLKKGSVDAGAGACAGEDTLKVARQAEARPAGDIRLRGRVLVVEDNPVNQKVVAGLLRRFGLRAEVVTNGKEAVEVLEMIPYDLVLMDIQMPVMDGISATRAIRQRDSRVINRQVPIVALTAHAFQEEISRFIAAGMNDYLPKPIERQRFIEVLTKWLPVCSEEVSEEGTEKDGGRGTKRWQSGDCSEEKVFDRDDFLERTMNDRELGRQVLEMFLDTGSELLASLEKAISDGDGQEIMRLSHSLKGSSGNVGAKRLSEFALVIEKIAEEGDLGGVVERFDKLKKEFELFSQQDGVREMLGQVS